MEYALRPPLRSQVVSLADCIAAEIPSFHSQPLDILAAGVSARPPQNFSGAVSTHLKSQGKEYLDFKSR